METSAVQKAVKYLGWLCIVLIIFVGVSALNALKENRYIGGGVSASNVITINGEGEVFAVPDIAEIGFSVFAEKKTLTEAQSVSAEKMNTILAFLKDQGIDDKDIKTTNYSANPKYEWTNEVTPMSSGSSGAAEPGYGGVQTSVVYPDYYPRPQNQVIVGYEVRQTITVKIRDTEKVGALVSGIGEKGATDIYGPTFTIDDEVALQREARQKAIDDAKNKAEQLAKDLGVRIVRIVSFSENGGGYYPMMFKGMEATVSSDSSVPPVPQIPVGENKITANVSITYEIR
ncbi:MAG: SIMPL domain-containing protein [Candidatus Campbellbacteria bacterium]|nr:SIMPL domain-containing protein [Candidatus Campbellbacteria bacterium]